MTRFPTRTVLPLALAAVALAGCGSHAEQDTTSTAPATAATPTTASSSASASTDLSASFTKLVQQEKITKVTGMLVRDDSVAVNHPDASAVDTSTIDSTGDVSTGTSADFPKQAVVAVDSAAVDMAAIQQHASTACGGGSWMDQVHWTFDKHLLEVVTCSGQDDQALVDGKSFTPPADALSAAGLRTLLPLASGLAPNGQLLSIDLRPSRYQVTAQKATLPSGGTCWYPQFAIPGDETTLTGFASGAKCEAGSKPSDDGGWGSLKPFRPATIDPTKAAAAFTTAIKKAGLTRAQANQCLSLEISDSNGKGPQAVVNCGSKYATQVIG